MGTVVVDRTGDGVAVVRLNRPEVLNALNLEALAALSGALRAEGTGDGARAIVLTGTGRAFSSGDDLAVTEDLDEGTFASLIEAFQDVTRALLDSRVPVVASLNGIAVGGAAEIACACDLRVGGPASEFLFPENGLGLTISNGATVTLPRLVGPGALGLVLLGERIGASRARDLGLIDVWVDAPDAVVEEATRIAGEVGEPGRATGLHLRMLRPPREEIERALLAEADAAAEAWAAGLPQAGVRRFYQRRRGRA